MRLLGATNAGAAPPLPDLAIPSFEAFPVEPPIQAPGGPPPLPPIPPDLLQAAAAMAPMPAAVPPALAVEPASAAGASAAGPQGIAAVGWRVTLPFEGGPTSHPAHFWHVGAVAMVFFGCEICTQDCLNTFCSLLPCR